MTTNPIFNYGAESATQQMYEDLQIQAIQFAGHDLSYIPRQINNLDQILGEDIGSSFTESYVVEMYVENAEGFEGKDLFQKFGVEIRDDVTFVVARKRWNDVVAAATDLIRPREGDLIYVPFAKALFEINEVVHEEPFYQLKYLPVYKLNCSLFRYNDEAINVDETGLIDSGFSGSQQLTLVAPRAFQVGEEVQQLVGTVTVSGTVVSVDGSEVVVGNISSDSANLVLFGAGPIEGLVSLLEGVVEEVAMWDPMFGDNDVIEEESTFFTDFDPNRPFGDF